MCQQNKGNYQGTLIYILHKDKYQPSIYDYVYLSVGYGSCSCCDTLLGIQGEDSVKDYKMNDNKSIDDYMKLFLNLIQSAYYMKEIEKEDI